MIYSMVKRLYSLFSNQNKIFKCRKINIRNVKRINGYLYIYYEIYKYYLIYINFMITTIATTII